MVNGADLSASTEHKFHCKELIFSTESTSINFSDVLAKCSVLHVGDFPNLQVIDSSREDTYFCRYQFGTGGLAELQAAALHNRPGSLSPREAATHANPITFVPLPENVKSEWERREHDRKARILEEQQRRQQQEAEALQRQAQSLAGKQLQSALKQGAGRGLIQDDPQTGQELFVKHFANALQKRNSWMRSEQLLARSQQAWDELNAETQAAWNKRVVDFLAQQQALKVSSTVMSTPTAVLDTNCGWVECKESFDTLDALREHLMASHIKGDEVEGFKCMWRDCHEAPLKMRSALARHVNERHLTIRRAAAPIPANTAGVRFGSSMPLFASPSAARPVALMQAPPTSRQIIDDLKPTEQELASAAPFRLKYSKAFQEHLTRLALNPPPQPARAEVAAETQLALIVQGVEAFADALLSPF